MRRRMFAGAQKFIFERAGLLRSQPTFAEELLWNYLKSKPLGFKFRRQHAYSNYILDFYCHALKLIIEVEEVKQHDEERQSHLEQQGLTILRLTNSEIRLQPEEALQKIDNYLQSKKRLL